jgi:hypothetical protein
LAGGGGGGKGYRRMLGSHVGFPDFRENPGKTRVLACAIQGLKIHVSPVRFRLCPLFVLQQNEEIPRLSPGDFFIWKG